MALGYPEMPRSFASQYTNNSLTWTTGGGGTTAFMMTGQAFGFNASFMKLVADVGTFYISFASTSLVALTDYKLTSGDGGQDFYDLDAGVAGITVGTTSTTASLRLGAWG